MLKTLFNSRLSRFFGNFSWKIKRIFFFAFCFLSRRSKILPVLFCVGGFLCLFSLLHAQNPLQELLTFNLPIYACNYICYNKNLTGSDLNNDGYDDFIYNFWNTELNQNEFHFHFGSSNPSTEPDMVIIKEPCAGGISWGGDLNGDGYKDIVYCVATSEFDPGIICICLGSENLDIEPDIILDGWNYGATGFSGLNGGYDFNGDGYNDIKAGWHFTFDLYYCYHIFYGSDNFDQDSDVCIEFEETILSASAVGDMNGDGCDDLIINHDIIGGIQFELYLGGTEMDNIPDYIFAKIYDGGTNYRPICNGDFNGDGFDDLIIGDDGILDIYFGSQDLDFALDTLAVENSGIGSLFYCDINNDSNNDVVTFGVTLSPYEVDIFLFYGGNTIPNQPDIIIPVNDNYSGVVQCGCNLGDFNGDGNKDIFIHNGNTGDPTSNATIYTMEISQNSDDEIASCNTFLTNYPNPFNPSTTIYFETTENTENDVIEIYNVKGQKVKTLECGESLATTADGVGYSISWDGTDYYHNQVSSGVYLYQIKTDEGVLMSKKMLLLR